MKDHMIRATAADAMIRAFAVSTKDTVEFARSAHDLSPVMCAALGRLLSGALMMGAMQKNDSDTVTIQISGDGPAKGLTATADKRGFVNGYCLETKVMLPPNENKKLDVGGAVGHGIIKVIKDLGLKEPYIGTCELVSGEIAEDLTYYFASSEQVPSSVGLGVLMNKDNTVNCAGGFIVQLMPFADEKTISVLESNLSKISSVTDILSSGKSPEDMLNILLDGLDPVFLDVTDVSFKCSCDRQRVTKALLSLGKEELSDMIAEDKPIEVRCHICNRAYEFSVSELKDLR